MALQTLSLSKNPWCSRWTFRLLEIRLDLSSSGVKMAVPLDKMYFSNDVMFWRITFSDSTYSWREEGTKWTLLGWRCQPRSKYTLLWTWAGLGAFGLLRVGVTLTPSSLLCWEAVLFSGQGHEVWDLPVRDTFGCNWNPTQTGLTNKALYGSI